MRIYLITLFSAVVLFYASSAFAQTSSAIMEKAEQFYLRGDYNSAKEMFSQVPSDESESSGIAAYYIGSILAHDGSGSPYKYFQRAIKFAPAPIKESALFQFSKYANANEDWEMLVEELSPFAKENKLTDILKIYYSEALYNLKDHQQSKSILSQTLTECFPKADSIAADMFVESRLDKLPFALQISIKDIPSQTPAAKARIAILEDKKIEFPQNQISYLAQIYMAENGDTFDSALLKFNSIKYKDSPFTWRAAYILAKDAFDKKEYETAELLAKDAQLFAPPIVTMLWRVMMLEGDALRMQKKYNQARPIYLSIALDRKIRGEPQAEALYKTGLCWYEEGDWSKAHAYFQHVIAGYYKFEYWSSRSYYLDARSLYSMGARRDALVTLVEYFRRSKDKQSPIYKEAKEFYNSF